ncbi:shikimate dehydrogenase [Phormidium tenue FACHB-886]|nr:shikimate dehydrogenase [Phormidium tenue FACHB-886]
MITGTTQLLGVIGHPIEHSLSPVMHNAAIAALGINAVYLPLPVSPADLPAAIAGFRAIGLRGFNVTIPHKQAIMPLLSEMTDLAQAVGAVNTVYPTEQGWGGTNTDVEGFIAPLKALRNWQQSIAVVLGGGGAARAVLAGCQHLGCSHIRVVGRNPEKLQQFHQLSTATTIVSVHPWETLPELLIDADLLVNTTPIGMFPDLEASPLSLADLASLKSGAIAYDLIYNPRPTQFLQYAQSQGATPIDGLEMLVQQGAAALRLWLQQPVPVDIMRRSLLEQL